VRVGTRVARAVPVALATDGIAVAVATGVADCPTATGVRVGTTDGVIGSGFGPPAAVGTRAVAVVPVAGLVVGLTTGRLAVRCGLGDGLVTDGRCTTRSGVADKLVAEGRCATRSGRCVGPVSGSGDCANTMATVGTIRLARGVGVAASNPEGTKVCAPATGVIV